MIANNLVASSPIHPGEMIRVEIGQNTSGGGISINFIEDYEERIL